MTPERQVMSKTEVRPLVLRLPEDGTPVILVRQDVVPDSSRAPGPRGARKWPGRPQMGHPGDFARLLGMPKSVLAVPDAIRGLCVKIRRVSTF